MPDITGKDILAWLDMQRDAVNTEIVYAAPADKKQYHAHLKIINWLAEQLQEMTAVEYLEACNKICDGIDGCSKCWLEPHCPFLTAQEFPRRAVEIVKKWKEEQDGND